MFFPIVVSFALCRIEMLTYVATWMNLEDTVLREVNHKC